MTRGWAYASTWGSNMSTNPINEIIALLMMGRDIILSRGLDRHAQTIDDDIGLGIDSLLTTSRAENISDTERTVTADHPSGADLRQFRRQLKQHKPKPKKWKCCYKPERRKTRSGDIVWGSVCQYVLKAGSTPGKIGYMWHMVSTGPTMPRSVMIKGKKMPICKSRPSLVKPSLHQR